MDIGRIDKRITIQRRATTLDDYGQEVNAWEDIGTVWANIKPIGGREKLRAGQVDSMLTHTVMVRYADRLMPPRQADAWRILYGSRIFNITAAMDVEEDRHWIVFDCTEGNEVGQ